MKKIYNIILLLTVYSGGFSLAQSGPGGVGNSSTNNLWVDANAVSIVNGDNVSTFSDVSGNGNDFNQPSSLAQPIYNTNVINGLPAVKFDGTSDYMHSNSIPALESNAVSWFAVYQKSSLQHQGILGGNYSSNSTQWLSYANSSSDYIINGHYGSGSLSYNKYLDDGAFNMVGNVVSPTNLSTYENGTLIGTKNAIYTAPTGHNFVSLGIYPSITTGYFLNGYVAEAFVFNYALNSLERILVENYLGAKYNLTIPTDLYSFEATHNINVIGIGDDGTNIHSDSKGNGFVEISTPTAMSAGEYLLCGHTNVDITSTVNADIPPSISTHHRYERTWRVDETGEVGNVTLVFDVSGSAGFGDPSTYNLLVDADGNFSDATIVGGVYNAGFQTMTFTLNLSSGDYFTLSGLLQAPTNILSVGSGDWSNPANWDCGCVPSANDSVFIQNTDAIGININANAYNLTIQPSATLKMTDNFDLSISGNLQVDGTAIITNGKILFIGSTAQNFSAGGNSIDLNNIEINNSNQSNVNFSNGQFVLNNTLFPLKGVMNIVNPATFTINSTSATTSGRVDQMTSLFSIVGDVTVKRFLASGNADNRNLASPITNGTLSMWDTDIAISGQGFPDGCAYSSSGCYYSVKQYENGAYIDITNINHVLENGVGYEVFVGTDLNSFNGATISVTGSLRNYQDFTKYVPRGGWSINGNPYASPILFSNTAHDINIGDYFYVYDASTGGYQWYDGSSNSSSIPQLANGLIASGQGFWLYNSNMNTAYRMFYKQTSKTSNSATFIRNSSRIDNSIYLTMKEHGTTYKCISSVGFDPIATDVHDSLDIRSLSTGREQASSLLFNSSVGMLRKQYLADNNRDKTLDMSVNILNSGYFTIDASNLENVTRYSNVTLIDNETGDVVNLKNQSSYTFFSEVGEYQRFQLILSNKSINTIETSIVNSDSNGDLTINQLGNAINIEAEEEVEGITEVSLVNLVGQEILFTQSINIQSGSNMIFMPEGLSGMYLVVIKSTNGVQTKKIML